MENNKTAGRPAGPYGKYERRNALKIAKNVLKNKEPLEVDSEIYRSLQLTSSEKWCLVSIYSLSENGLCYATNAQIGENIGLTGGCMGTRIGQLEDKGFISRESFCGEKNPETGGNKVRIITILKVK